MWTDDTFKGAAGKGAAKWAARSVLPMADTWRTGAVMAAGDGDDDDANADGRDGNTSVITRTRAKTKKPSMYRVLLLNDDFTPMEFVVDVLARFFNMDLEMATKVMLHVHTHGVGECGVFTYEVAETKVTQVMDYARQNQHPLQCVMEKK